MTNATESKPNAAERKRIRDAERMRKKRAEVAHERAKKLAAATRATLDKDRAKREYAQLLKWARTDGARQRKIRGREKHIAATRAVLLALRQKYGSKIGSGLFAASLNAPKFFTEDGKPWDHARATRRLALLAVLEQPGGPWADEPASSARKSTSNTAVVSPKRDPRTDPEWGIF